LLLVVGFLQPDQIATANVTAVGVAQVAAQQVQGQRVALNLLDQRLEFVQAL